MTGKPFAWVLLCLIVLLSTGQVQAGGMMFGTDETIHVIQPTKNPKYELGYKTSIYFFIAGCYVKDEGYALREVGDTKSYISLTDADIRKLQQEGMLPNPLPAYSLSFWDYLFGYSNWIILAVFVGIPALKGLWDKKKQAEAQETFLPEEPDEDS